MEETSDILIERNRDQTANGKMRELTNVNTAWFVRAQPRYPPYTSLGNICEYSVASREKKRDTARLRNQSEFTQAAEAAAKR